MENLKERTPHTISSGGVLKKGRIKKPKFFLNDLQTKTHGFILFMILSVLMLFCQTNDIWIGPASLMAVLHSLFIEFRKESSMRLMYGALLFVTAGGIPSIVPLLFVMIAGYDQDKLQHSRITGLFDEIDSWIQEVTMPWVRPLYGVNDGGVLVDIYEIFCDKIGELRDDLSWDIRHEAEFVRELGVNADRIPIESQPLVEPGIVDKRFHQLSKQVRLGTAAALVCIAMIYTGLVSSFLIVVALLFYHFAIPEPTESYDNKIGGGVKSKDGVYSVSTKLLGFWVSGGMGVVKNGILHVPYHVCNAAPLYLGRVMLVPSYINAEIDLVCYGGLPQFEKPRTKTIVVNCETAASRTSYVGECTTDELTGNIVWASVTKPGESGSPVFWVDEEDKLHLIALAGRYVQDKGVARTEFYTPPPNIKEGSYIQVLTHPGSGKTRNILPTRAIDLVSRGKRVLVTGPTRVVCMEMYNALKSRISVGLNIQGSSNTNRHAKIQIAAHHTAAQMIHEGDALVREIDAIIIDEAHYQNASTIILRRQAQHLMEEKNITLIEMSATLDGRVADGSNYDITDIKIKDSEIPEIIVKELDAGSRVLVFVSSLDSPELGRWLPKFRAYDPVKLSRRTFVEAMVAVKDETRRLIISTPIAECGINIPDLDVVVDVGRRYGFFSEGGVIYGKSVDIDMASKTQRRGRVGRVKPGRYYYVLDAEEVANQRDAEETDADIICTGRKWGIFTNEFDIRLTDKQVSEWFNNPNSPLELYITHNSNGEKKKSEELSRSLNWLRQGEAYYIGCRLKSCTCNGNYRWYDERFHHLLVPGKITSIP